MQDGARSAWYTCDDMRLIATDGVYVFDAFLERSHVIAVSVELLADGFERVWH